MKLKYYLRGLGIGIAVTAIILTIANAGGQKTLTDEEIMQRAEELGMIRPEEQKDNTGSDGRTIDALSNSQQKKEEGSSEEVDKEEQKSQEGQKSSDGQTAKENEDSSKKQEEGEDSTSSKDQKEGENQASSNGQKKENQPSSEDQKSSGSQTQTAQGNQTSSEEQKEEDSNKPKEGQSDEQKGETDSSSPQESQASQAGQGSQNGDAQSQKTEYVAIEIAQGDFSDRVSQKLKEAGLVEDASDFNNYLVTNGVDGRLTIGSHQIPKGAKYEEIAKILCERGGNSQ